MTSVMERLQKSTVLIRCGDSEGSGFFFGGSGHVVTAAHVVRDAYDGDRVAKFVGWGNDGDFRARLLAYSREKDLAILKVDWTPEFFLLPAASPPKQLESVLAAGFPFGTLLLGGKEENLVMESSLNPCHVTALREQDGVSILQLDGQMNPGNSGGPVVNQSGELVGIISSAVEGGGLNFAIASDELLEVVSEPVSLMLRFQGFTNQSLSQPTPISADWYFLREPSDRGLTMKVKLAGDGVEGRVVPMKRVEDGRFEGTLPPFYELLEEDTQCRVLVEFKDGRTLSGRLSYAPLILHGYSGYIADIERIEFDGTQLARAVLRGGPSISLNAIELIEGLKGLEFKENKVFANADYREIVRVSTSSYYSPSRMMLRVTLSESSGHPIQDVVVEEPVLKMAKSSGLTTRWIGPRVSPITRQDLWGPSLRAQAEERPAGLPSAVNLSDRILVRAVPEEVNPSLAEDAVLEWVNLNLPLGGGEFIPVLHGERMVINFPATRSFAVFDMKFGRITHFAQWNGERCLIAGSGKKIYLFLDNRFLLRLDAVTLEYEGAAELDLPFAPQRIDGSLGLSQTLVLHGPVLDEQHADYALYAYDLKTLDLTRVKARPLNGRRCFPLDNGWLYHGGDYYVRNDGGFSRIPVGQIKVGHAIGWSGRLYVNDGVLQVLGEASPREQKVYQLRELYTSVASQANGDFFWSKDSESGLRIYECSIPEREIRIIASEKEANLPKEIALIYVESGRVHLFGFSEHEGQKVPAYRIMPRTNMPFGNYTVSHASEK